MQLTNKEIEVLDAYAKHRSQRKAAESLGMARRTYRRYFDSAKAKSMGTPIGYKTTKITTDHSGSETDQKKRTGKVVKTSTLYGSDGSVVGEWVMRQPEQLAVDDYVSALNKHFIENVKPLTVPYLNANAVTDQDMVLFMSVDEHIGVRLVAEQCGKDYGLDDAIALMTDSFEKLLARTPKTSQCLYVNLGDQFHANDHMDVTPAHKNPMQSATSFNTVADAVIKLNKRRIELLASHYEFLDIRGVAGNHDTDAMGWLFRCYKHMFDEERISVQFWGNELGVEQFGNNMLGFHHGHKMKPDALAGACADRFSEIYGESKMRYLHTGHYHKDQALDTWGGFKFQGHRTAAPQDWYSTSLGHTPRQAMKSFVYNLDEGEVATFTKNII